MNGRRGSQRFTLKAKKGVTSPFLFGRAYLYVKSVEFPGPREFDLGVHQREAFDVACVQIGDRQYTITSRMVDAHRFVWETR